MRSVTKLLAGVAGSVVIVASAVSVANAADVIPIIPPSQPAVIIPPPAPVALFSGPYVGGIIGILHGPKLWDNTPYGPFGTTEHTVSGLLLGAEAGYRFQMDNLVFGVEGDWAWTNANGASECGPGAAYTCATDLDWIATITGTAGFAMNNVLLYAEAGLAFADENFTVDGPGLVDPLTGTLVNRGWVLGGGAVIALNNGMYIKGEYNYINFGTDTGIDMDATEFDLTQRAHVFKLGIGIQF